MAVDKCAANLTSLGFFGYLKKNLSRIAACISSHRCYEKQMRYKSILCAFTMPCSRSHLW